MKNDYCLLESNVSFFFFRKLRLLLNLRGFVIFLILFLCFVIRFSTLYIKEEKERKEAAKKEMDLLFKTVIVQPKVPVGMNVHLISVKPITKQHTCSLKLPRRC